MYNTILIPVDIHHPSIAEKIVNVGKKLSGPGTKIALMYAMEETPSYVENYLPEGIVEKNREDAYQRVRALARSANVEATVEIRMGPPHNAILEAAKGLGADLIIVGSHRPGLQDYFLGSTASRVVRHADCSVLVER
ncbi:MAG: universal stress protein [Paracoccaceae bacterium]